MKVIPQQTWWKQAMMLMLSFLLIISSALPVIGGPLTVQAAADNTVYVSNTGNDDTNDGKSKDSPFATIQKAFEEIGVESGEIVLLSTITMTESLQWRGQQSRELTIRSEEGETHSIIRGKEFVGTGDNANDVGVMFFFGASGKADITFENVIIDGNNVPITADQYYGIVVQAAGREKSVTLKNVKITNHTVDRAHLFFANTSSKLNIEEGTEITSNTLVGERAVPPAILGAGGGARIEFKAGEISGNTVAADSNGVMVAIGSSGTPSFNMTGGKITNNHLNGKEFNNAGKTIGNVAVFMRGNTNNSRYEFGGEAYVYDNLNQDDEQRNVYLDNGNGTEYGNAYLAVVSALEKNAKIGVYASTMPTEANPTVLVARTITGAPGHTDNSGDYTPTVNDMVYFESDKASSAVIKFSGTNNHIVLEPIPPKLNNIWWNQASVEGKEITLTFSDDIQLIDLNGFDITVGNDAVTNTTYKVEGNKLILTLENEPTGDINIQYTDKDDQNTPVGNLKGKNGIAVEDFDFNYPISFANDLKVTTPADNPAQVTVPKPEVKGTVAADSTVNVVIKDKDGNVVKNAGGAATVDGNGNWTFTPGVDLTSGDYTFEITATSADGKSVVTKTKAITIVAPKVPLDKKPGGIGIDPVLWLKANDGVSNTDKNLTGWEDKAKINEFTLDIPAGQVDKTPKVNLNGLNFNPSVKFNNPTGVDHYATSAKLIGDKAIDFTSGFAVYRWPASGSAHTLVGSTADSEYAVQILGGTPDGIGVGLVGGKDAKDPNNGFGNLRHRWQYLPGSPAKATMPHIVDVEIQRSEEFASPGNTGRFNGKDYPLNRGTNFNYSIENFTPVIGATTASDADYALWGGSQADVAEIILYDQSTKADVAKIETYLAVKYGITLAESNYVGTDDTTLWDKATNTTYHNNIAGIGRDNAEDLYQKQSRSVNTGTQIAIGLTELKETNELNKAELTDKQYLIWGDNGKASNSRVWKVKNTNSVGEVQVSIPKTAIAENSVLLVSDAEDFTTSTSHELTEITLNGVAHYATKVTFNDNEYFTFTTPAPKPTSAELDGEKITVTFDQEVEFSGDAKNGFTVTIGGQTITLDNSNFKIDPTDATKVIITLPTGTNVTDKDISVSYDKDSGNLKGKNGVPVGDFTEEIGTVKVTVSEPSTDTITTNKPTFSGTATPGATVKVKISDTVTLEATADANGNWSVTPDVALADGDYTVEITAEKDGKTSAPITKALTIDTNQYVPYTQTDNVADIAPNGITYDPAAGKFEVPSDVDKFTFKDGDKDISATKNQDGTWKFTELVPHTPTGEITNINPNGVTYDKTTGKFEVPSDVTEFTFKDGDKEMTATKDADGNWTITPTPTVNKEPLQTKYDAVKGLKKSAYTSSTWGPFEKAKQEAEKVLNDPDATQEDVDKTLQDLDDAHKALKKKPVSPPTPSVDKSKLQAQADDANGLSEDEYTPDSWNTFKDALTAAEDVLKDPNATQQQVDDALDALKNAQDKLVPAPVAPAVDKSKLQAQADDANGLSEDEYTPDSWNTFKDALTAAEDVLKDPNATQQQVDDALDALKNAQDKLVPAPVAPAVDKSKLQAQTDEANELLEKDYTPDSWNRFKDALTAAEDVLKDPDATQQQVDDALDALKEAQNKLVPVAPAVDKSKLQAQADGANGLSEDKYTPESWNTFKDALTAAEDVLNDPDATQQQVDDALDALQQAQSNLVPVGTPAVDKSKLQAQADGANGLSEEKYTPDSWNRFKDALSAAEHVLNDPDATQQQVDDALRALQDAQNSLVPVDATTVDKSKLQAQADGANGLSEKNYTPDSWNRFKDALTAAEHVLNNPDATQQQVDDALRALQDAQNNLVPVETTAVDKSKLQAQVDSANKLSESNYTANSWNAFQNALTNAKKVLADPHATQQQVDDALAALIAAQNALVPYTSGGNGGGSSGGSGGSTSTPSPTPTPEGPKTETILVDLVIDGENPIEKTPVTIKRTRETNGEVNDRVELTLGNARDAVNKAKEIGNTVARIVIPDAKDEVTKVTVDIPKQAIALLQENGINLEIFTNNVWITIPQTSMAGIEDDFYFRLVPVKDANAREAIKIRAKAEKVVRDVMQNDDITVVARPMTIETNLSSRPVLITLPLRDVALPTDPAEREAFLKQLAVFIEHTDGEKKVVFGEVVTMPDNTLGLQISVSKFSTFTIINVGKKEEVVRSHEAYIKGFEDGTFKPNQDVTRKQVALMIARNLGYVDGDTVHTAPFKDVAVDADGAGAIAYLKQLGIMNGDEHGNFNGSAKMTRAQMAAVVANYKKLDVTEVPLSFTDTKNHWAKYAIEANREAGIITGFEDGTFKPQAHLTRAHAVKMINRMFDRGPLYGLDALHFSDVNEQHWAFEDIAEASTTHQYTLDAHQQEWLAK